MISTPITRTGIRWRCSSTGSTSCGRSGSRSKPPRSSATASAGAIASRASTTTTSAATSSTSTLRPPAASDGARTRARRSCMSRRRRSRPTSSTAAVPGLERSGCFLSATNPDLACMQLKIKRACFYLNLYHSMLLDLIISGCLKFYCTHFISDCIGSNNTLL